MLCSLPSSVQQHPPHRLQKQATTAAATETDLKPFSHPCTPPATVRTTASFVDGNTMQAAPAEIKTAPPQPMPEPKTSSLDWEWIGDLGQGGFAKVSKVRNRNTLEVLAFKQAFSPSPYAREEAEVLRRVAWKPSPFVVQCHDVSLAPNGCVLSLLEFMDLGSLLDAIRHDGCVGCQEPVLAQVAGRCLLGLHHLHSRGVAHLDVKPDNFLLNSRTQIKINDFNTSRIIYGPDGESLFVPATMGTISHFSPERFTYARIGPLTAMAADVWSLGLTILETFTGRPPIVPEAVNPTWEDWKKAICDREPPSVPKDMEASPELRDLLSMCLQKNPVRRAKLTQLMKHPFFELQLR